MGEQKLLSIIVPVFNMQAYLSECMNSILSQTYTNLEVILVDSDSQDSSSKMCDEYAQKDSRVRVIHMENRGPSAARNAGLKAATGELIGFVDADDVIHNRMYELLSQAMEKTDADVVICRERSFEKILEWESIDDAQLVISSQDSADDVCLHFTDDWNGLTNWATNKIYKRSAIGDITFIEDKFLEDVRFNSDILSSVKKSTFLKNRLYGYRVREDSAIKARTDKIYADFAEALVYQYKVLKKNCSEDVADYYGRFLLRKLARVKAQAYQDGKKTAYEHLADYYNETVKLIPRKSLSMKEKMIVFLSTKTKVYDRHQRVEEF